MRIWRRWPQSQTRGAILPDFTAVAVAGLSEMSVSSNSRVSWSLGLQKSPCFDGRQAYWKAKSLGSFVCPMAPDHAQRPIELASKRARIVRARRIVAVYITRK